MASTIKDDKTMEVVEHIDHKFEPSLADPEKSIGAEVYKFGAHAKTDPVEIALVRKLDTFIMVSFGMTTSSRYLQTDLVY